MSQRYLDDEELAMLGDLFRDEHAGAQRSLSITMDEALFALLTGASSLELKLDIQGTQLTFPVSLSPGLPAGEDAALTAPQITSLAGSAGRRAWRLPNPDGLQLLTPDGGSLDITIRDLSISGMRLVSQHSLFEEATTKTVLLKLDSEHQLPLNLKPVKERRGEGLWVTTVQFELGVADRLALSEFVFRGFLERMEQERL
ncbi:PilZ domain-containing protein [Oceanimonas sp. CHS3-5]|uniref:PilZ domain-containing protein n=1 Tax=Oceanimonas sp. CHS3-5 TaxID=3068186 RepID=UPI00273DE288|nr:PilZ domain-containing protein [Oceanimonas sp. CHS3-5]MDP5290822.1 PilZ domain-containing protein [Oceanimonas sp. CHS3-5]